VSKRKLRWFGHVTRAKGTLANIILQSTVEGNRKRGRPKRIWMDDVNVQCHQKKTLLSNHIREGPVVRASH
jgi:hypothetical protein